MYTKKMYDGGMGEGNEDVVESSRKKMLGKKGAVMAIVAKLGKKPMSPMSEGGEGDMGGDMDMLKEAKMSAATEVMSALKSGDKMAFAGALENFLKCCGDMESED